MRLLPFTFLVLLASATAQVEWPGPRPDGSTLLPGGWSLRPTGRQIPLASDLPVRTAWHPDGKTLAIQHAGYREHEIVLFDAGTERITERLAVGRTWSGLAFSPDGTRLYASGGVDDVVHVFEGSELGSGYRAVATFAVGRPGAIDLPAGLVVDGAHRLFVPLQRGHAVVVLDREGRVLRTVSLPDGSYPFECAVQGDTLFVSLWGRAEVRCFSTETGEALAVLPAGQHPSEMRVSPDGSRLFVSNGNENSVTVIDVAARQVEETIGSALYPLAPPGSTPNSVALSPNGHVLLVANADNNNAAVIDVSQRRRSRSLGFIPLGAYPTSIRFSPRTGKVVVANGKGSAGSQRNPGGPNPEAKHPTNLAEYTGSMFSGSLSVFEFPAPKELQELSARAYACSPLRADGGVRGLETRPADSPIPARPGGATPITHCVYIIKENRTYDQVLGDDPRGNGDPTLCIFPEDVTPNHHALARDFVLLDNFYTEAEVSADGHEWTMGAYASDVVERTWPVTYGGKGSARQEGGKSESLGYPAEGNFPLAFPKNGYLFDRAKEAGLTYRSYGEFVQNSSGDEPPKSGLPALAGHYDPGFRGYDLDYKDVDRATRFIAELERATEAGELPRLIVIRLPNDHTSGTRVGRPTPRAYVADNDLALGRVVEALSHSPFWKHMAIFVVEDDAQNGSDHVDAHRTLAFVASPWARRGAVVSEMYSTCGMLRTIELILGLEPMSQFDAAALPLYGCFAAEPDLAPWHHRPATWPLDEKNDETAYGAERSARFDLAREDAADDLELNEVIWKSIRGADSEMPPPRRAAFVRIADDD